MWGLQMKNRTAVEVVVDPCWSKPVKGRQINKDCVKDVAGI
jgi:hypothetical protein